MKSWNHLFHNQFYNFHLFKHANPELAIRRIHNRDIKMLHYHNSFDSPKQIIIKDYSLLSKKNSILNWIEKELINCNINHRSLCANYYRDALLSIAHGVGTNWSMCE